MNIPISVTFSRSVHNFAASDRNDDGNHPIHYENKTTIIITMTVIMTNHNNNGNNNNNYSDDSNEHRVQHDGKQNTISHNVNIFVVLLIS